MAYQHTHTRENLCGTNENNFTDLPTEKYVNSKKSSVQIFGAWSSKLSRVQFCRLVILLHLFDLSQRYHLFSLTTKNNI